MSPLEYAISHGTPAVMKALMECGVVWTTHRTAPDRTPAYPISHYLLQFAIERNKPVFVDAILTDFPETANTFILGAPYTPIALAIRCEAADVMLVLVANPNVSQTDVLNFGAEPTSALEFAAKLGLPDIIQIIGKRPQKECDRALSKSLFKGSAAAAKILLDWGADVNTHELTSRTPLFYACVYRHEELALLLIKNNADLTVEGLWVMAVNGGLTEVVKVLRAKGLGEPTAF
jgi:hypothetical protein